MIKVLHIVGARPQFIKLFPLHLEMKKRGFNQKILHTGQHFDTNMSDVFFDEMGIPQPDFNLNIHSLSHGAMTGRMIEGIETILLNKNEECPCNYYKVALFLDKTGKKKDYHFYKENKEGGTIAGTYIHGIFENDNWRDQYINLIRKSNKLPQLNKKSTSYKIKRESIINNLANEFDKHLNIKALLT